MKKHRIWRHWNWSESSQCMDERSPENPLTTALSTIMKERQDINAKNNKTLHSETNKLNKYPAPQQAVESVNHSKTLRSFTRPHPHPHQRPLWNKWRNAPGKRHSQGQPLPLDWTGGQAALSWKGQPRMMVRHPVAAANHPVLWGHSHVTWGGAPLLIPLRTLGEGGRKDAYQPRDHGPPKQDGRGEKRRFVLKRKIKPECCWKASWVSLCMFPRLPSEEAMEEAPHPTLSQREASKLSSYQYLRSHIAE